MDSNTVKYIHEHYPDFKHTTFKLVHLMVQEHLNWLTKNRAYNKNYKQPTTKHTLQHTYIYIPQYVNTKEAYQRPPYFHYNCFLTPHYNNYENTHSHSSLHACVFERSAQEE